MKDTAKELGTIVQGKPEGNGLRYAALQLPASLDQTLLKPFVSFFSYDNPKKEKDFR